jgi:thiol-disulfide isomerase/thioredoxin
MHSFLLVFAISIFTWIFPLPVQSPELMQSGHAVKTRFIVFSGSDWCKGCIQFRKKVLNDPSFESFAEENLELVIADFPQRLKLPRDVVRQNEALAEKYNPKGVFPNLVLLSPDSAHVEVIQYTNQTPQEFIKELKNHLQHLNG